MSVSFSVMLENKNNLKKLVKISKNFFNIKYSQDGLEYSTLIDDNNSYIINVSSDWLDFIISDDKQENIDNKVKLITKFINDNFEYETIGIKYFNSNFRFDTNEFRKIEVINIH